MRLSEAIEQFKKLLEAEGDVELMVLDGFNGGGSPRTINIGPRVHIIEDEDSEYTADCEDRVGEKIVIIGYGSY